MPTLAAKYSRPELDGTEEPCVALSQSTSSPCSTDADLLAALIALITGQPLPEFAEGGGTYTTKIKAQSTVSSYQLHVTHGTLGDRQTFTENKTELVSVTGADWTVEGVDMSGRFELEFDNLVLASFVGDVFDADGNPIPPPHVSISGNFLVFDPACIGTLSVTYQATWDEYTLDIDGREDEPENNYQSTVYAESECGNIDSTPVAIPDCVQAGWNSQYPWDNPFDDDSAEVDPVPDADPVDANLSWEYCSPHKLISASPAGLVDADSNYPG